MRLSTFSVVDHYPEGARDIAGLYRQVVEQAVLADRLGFDTVWVAEHHFVDYGVVPNPAMLLASLAPRTSRVKLGPAVSILPFHDPRTVAENYVMLDQLSDGRAVLGVGSGYVAGEYAGFGLDAAEKHERFAESLAILRKLTAGERVTLAGKFSRLDDVGLNIRPVQPRLPISVATGRRKAVGAIGAQGDSLMFMAYTMCSRLEEAGTAVADFRRGRVGAGHAGGANVAVGLHTHVAASDAEARDAAEESFDRYCATRVKARKRGFAEAVSEGVVLFGGPSRIADQLAALHRMGVDEVLTFHNFGLIDPAAAQSSMTRLMQDVVPLVEERVAAVAA